MRIALLALLARVVVAQAGALAPSVSVSSVVAGGSATLTVAYTASAPVAALQWSLALPAGVSIAWSAGAEVAASSKALTCNAAGTVCVVAALNTSAVGSGVLASGVVSFGAAVRGPQALALSSTLGASPAGVSVAVTGAAVSVAVLSPFDLNGDGKVDGSDFAVALSQVDRVSPCASANFASDGCTVVDLVLLAVDAASSAP